MVSGHCQVFPAGHNRFWLRTTDLKMSDTQWALTQQIRCKEAGKEERGTKAGRLDACLGCLHLLSFARPKGRGAVPRQTPARCLCFTDAYSSVLFVLCLKRATFPRIHLSSPMDFMGTLQSIPTPLNLPIIPLPSKGFFGSTSSPRRFSVPIVRMSRWS